MRVHFVLPTEGSVPVGGYKVVYEYANGLVEMGHDVIVTHPLVLLPSDARIFLRPRTWLTYIKRWFLRTYTPAKWFKVDPRVKLRLVPWLSARFMPAADAVVATAWETADWVTTYQPQHGAKFYLIQHFEQWSGDRDQVLKTWKLPMHKIVISKWLGAMLDDLGELYSYITNGLDFKAFGMDVLPERRHPHSVAMLYHHAEWKGSRYGLEAIKLLKAKFPDLSANLFGVPSAPTDLPSWITYHQLPAQPQLRALYNQAADFVGPSLTEGWGLPPAEAMMCGAAVVLTDVDGHREFARDHVNALMCQPADASALADAVAQLFTDQDLRLRLAYEGERSIQVFTWARAVEALDRTLAKHVEP